MEVTVISRESNESWLKVAGERTLYASRLYNSRIVNMTKPNKLGS